MKIILKKMKLFGFLSFGEAEIDFRDKSYCLITGINHNPKDAAKANGVGKSAIGSAVCWALTGQTVQGLKSNIANINLDKGCFVRLEFDIDKDSYIVTRYKDYGKIGTDLKIELNGKDISGKGIREGEAILAQYLPDLTPELLSSVLILGQGLPNKFSANTPSGRKEVLEKLSKSDFMIEDIKNRIDSRNKNLEQSKRQLEDNKLSSESKLDIYNKSLLKYQQDLTNLELSHDADVDNKILTQETKISDIKDKQAQVQKEYEDNQAKLNAVNDEILAKSNKINEQIARFRDSKNEYLLKQTKEENRVKSDINVKKAELQRLKNIKDVCPTCGQKIPNVIKPDTSNLESEILRLNESLNVIQEDTSREISKYDSDINNLNSSFINESKGLQDIKRDIAAKNEEYKAELSSLTLSINKETAELNRLSYMKQNYENNLKMFKNQISETEKSISDLKLIIDNLSDKISSNQEHLNVISTMNTLIKRDFRGVLLQNIILFIDRKVKEYSEVVFGTRDLNFALDGNNICITYCDKNFENLSGGEQQRVDLILQFALRDMMSQYVGFSSNVLFLDELFDSLDGQGCDAILDLIAQKITDVESIFIISHRSSDLGIPCDSEIIVEKNENGVSSIR